MAFDKTGLRFRERFVEAKPLLCGTEIIYYDQPRRELMRVDRIREPVSVLDRPVTERTWDENHGRIRHGLVSKPYWSKTKKTTIYEDGGPFLSIKSRNSYYELSDVYDMDARPYLPDFVVRRYVGGFVPSGYGSDTLDVPTMGNVGLSGNPYGADYADSYQYGASAWNRFRPKIAGAHLDVFLGEAHEIPSMLKTTARGFHKAWKSFGGHPREFFRSKELANQFLNHQFGWLPFVNDLRDFYNTYVNHDRRLRQLRRDNGRFIRRKGVVSSSKGIKNFVDHQSDNAPLVWPIPPTQVLAFPYPNQPNKWGNTFTYVDETDDIWFSGAFRYWIQPSKLDESKTDWYYKLAREALLFGGVPTPSTVWNLMPWSWLADWASNIGDVIDNVTSMGYDNMVARYAYVMRHRRLRMVNSSVIHSIIGNIPLYWEQNIDSKCRTKASPYGFGLSLPDFSERQLMILAALGITRSPGR